MEAWSTSKLGNLCLKVSSGGTPLRSISEYYENGIIPWLKTGEVKKGVIYDTEEKITESGLENSSAKLIPANSVIVAMYGDGDTAGNVAINKIPLATNQACCNFTLNPEQAYYRFVYYYLKGSYNNLINLKLGGSQQNLNAYSLKSFPLTHPCVKAQEKIAAILSAYDELIENNQRRIALLEKMAEEIYREWFVRMRFPGHEKVKKVKGVPEDWCVAELKELASINPSSINRQGNPESILYIDISSVSTNRIDDVTPYISANAPGRARRRVKHGDVIWSSVRPANRAYCLIYEPPENLIVSTGFAVIRPSAATPFTFLFFAVTSNPFVDQMTTVAKGAAYPATSFDDFEKAKLLVPTEGLLRCFHEKTEPMFRQKHFLQQQSEWLRKTRDLLLPRLISGKLSVEHLDIQFPPGMEDRP
jgi:type I restriction enzyme S subunit